jgi:hypothetical protein
LKVLVYGYYWKDNFGDELFKRAFKLIFPKVIFQYTDSLNKRDLDWCDVVFFGGGSILSGAIALDNIALDQIIKPIYYIGVGLEEPHPDHIQLLKQAKLIAIRKDINCCKVMAKQTLLNDYTKAPTIVIPDLVYALHSNKNILDDDDIEYEDEESGGPFNLKSILVIPNVSTLPDRMEPNWKHLAWEYYKSEFAQALDYLYEDGFRISFLPFSRNSIAKDSWAANEILAKMQHKNQLVYEDSAINQAGSILSNTNIVITQRYHGAVLGNLYKNNTIIIHHHSKLERFEPADKINFYGFRKDDILESVNNFRYHRGGFNLLQSSFYTSSSSFKELNKLVLG